MSKRFLALDGLRGVCALSIVFFHCIDLFHKGSFFQHGYLAVDAFFILSGFLIFLTYEEKLRAGGNTRRFLLNRARRLFPTYWLGAAIGIALFVWMAHSGYLATEDAPWMIWIFIPLTTFLLIPDYLTPDGVLYPAMNSVAWSLFAEWIAYLGYAAGVFRWKTKFIAALALVCWAIMTYAGYHSGTAWCAGADRPTLFTCGLLRCAAGFLAGVTIYRIHREPWFQRLPSISTEILLVSWLVIAVIPTPVATAGLDAFLVIVCAPLLVCLLIRSDAKAPAYCETLGKLSYPLYVVHPGIIVLAAYTPVFGLSHGPHPLNATLVVALTLALAWAVALITTNLRIRPVLPTPKGGMDGAETGTVLSPG
jgi:peptidoglycan/LPS O-acetylase OafA/YrhL